MMVVNGLLSSCDASPTNRCCAISPASMRASIWFMVTASAGLALLEGDLETSLRTARSALILAKQGGRACLKLAA